MRRSVLVGATLALLLPACAYFNAIYNAERLYSEAERAQALGQTQRASTAYGESIEKAARGLRKDPDGRWADDALYLIGRAHFARGEHARAAAALQRAIAASDDEDLRAGARAYLGAARVRMGEPEAALQELDEALRRLDDASQLTALARLWRARAGFALEREGAWEDLLRAASGSGAVAREAMLEQAGRAIRGGDGERAADAFAALLRDAEGHRMTDTIRALARSANRRWDADRARALLASVEDSPWPTSPRDSLALFRAGLAAADNDFAAAAEEAGRVASRSVGGVADMARIARGRWLLATAAGAEDLSEVRALLLPALARNEARDLLRSIKSLDVLLERAGQGQPLALFAAAELARDRLGAEALARTLFIAYADLASSSVWAPKALLAAAAIAASNAQRDSLVQRARTHEGSVYVASLDGLAAAESFASAEERLGRGVAALTAAADQEAARRDLRVAQAAAAIDSVRAAAEADSLKLACGTLLDSLGVVGLRADSMRAACIRRDSLRMDSVLVMDTALLLSDSIRKLSGRKTPRAEQVDTAKTGEPPP